MAVVAVMLIQNLGFVKRNLNVYSISLVIKQFGGCDKKEDTKRGVWLFAFSNADLGEIREVSIFQKLE